MYEVLDNFLSEEQFKNIQRWGLQRKLDDHRDWPRYLIKNDGVDINKPMTFEGFNYMNKAGSEILEQLQEKIIEYLNDNVDKYKLVPSNGNLTDFVSDIYRYRKGDGILLHRDSDGVETYGKRYGISFYLNDEWNPNWGGESLIYKTYGKNKYHNNIPKDLYSISSIIPKRNRLVIIDGLWHRVYPNMNPNLDRVVIQSFMIVKKKTNQ